MPTKGCIECLHDAAVPTLRGVSGTYPTAESENGAHAEVHFPTFNLRSMRVLWELSKACAFGIFHAKFSSKGVLRGIYEFRIIWRSLVRYCLYLVIVLASLIY